jgi:hypothetical protein
LQDPCLQLRGVDEPSGSGDRKFAPPTDHRPRIQLIWVFFPALGSPQAYLGGSSSCNLLPTLRIFTTTSHQRVFSPGSLR